MRLVLEECKVFMGIKNIYWHAFFKVNIKEKVRKLLAKFDDVCEQRLLC